MPPLPRPTQAALAACLASLAAISACQPDPRPAPPPPASASAAASAASAPAPPERRPAPAREGGALVRAASEDALYLADEDQGVVRRIALPVDARTPPIAVKMPGPPASVLALSDRVLVTIRGIAKRSDPGAAPEGPGLLLVMRPDRDAGLVELARVELPADAWGIAITPDEKTALVTSAWTHQVSAVDIAGAKRLWSLDVAREPRGVAVLPDGKTAYITHLVRAPLTRIDRIDGEPGARSVPFPAAPLRTPPDRLEAATLAYAAALSPDGARLFVPRHALGALGESAWNGQPTVDILLTADDTPLARRSARHFIMLAGRFMKSFSESGIAIDDPHMTGPAPAQLREPFIQPRAVIYRKRTQTLLVASEGTDRLAELDALSIDPSLGPLRSYDLGGAPAEDPPGRTRCGAPTGIALSADEASAFVFCRSSHDLAIVRLDAYDTKVPYEESVAALSLGPDPLPEQAAIGRRLYYSARDGFISGSFACAACHPEGRDDGHVWHEDEAKGHNGEKFEIRSMHAFEMHSSFDGLQKGVPRQTPMLAGRVAAFGPYGWKGRSQTLRHRVLIGFSIHRWLGGGAWGVGDKLIARAEAIAEFARKGLTPPPREAREATPEERRGEQIFNDPNVGCAACHLPKTEYTNRAAVGLGEWSVDKTRFDPEPEDWRFKTPSLLYIGGTPPYYHDGSAATLEQLIDQNGSRMGHTKQLSKEDRAALVAFLKTL